MGLLTSGGYWVAGPVILDGGFGRVVTSGRRGVHITYPQWARLKALSKQLRLKLAIVAEVSLGYEFRIKLTQTSSEVIVMPSKTFRVSPRSHRVSPKSKQSIPKKGKIPEWAKPKEAEVNLGIAKVKWKKDTAQS